MILTKDQIIEADDIVTEVVPVPEWGGDVIVTTISARDRDLYEQEMAGIGKNKVIENFRARLIAMCLVDESGKRIFEKSEVVKLGKKNAKSMDRIFEVCQRLNGISEKDVEELEKNSEKTQSCNSSLD